MGRIDGCESDRNFGSAGHFLRASRHGAGVAVGVRVAPRPGKSVPSAGTNPDGIVGAVIPPDESVGSVTGTSMGGRVIAGAAAGGVLVGGRVGRGAGGTGRRRHRLCLQPRGQLGGVGHEPGRERAAEAVRAAWSVGWPRGRRAGLLVARVDRGADFVGGHKRQSLTFSEGGCMMSHGGDD